MKITRIQTIPISVPLDPARAIKSGRGGAHTLSPFLLVKVYSDAGHVGLGEVSCTPRWSGEDQVSARHFIDHYFAPILIGEDPTDIARTTRLFWSVVAGNYFTKSGVEMALWDLVGKAQNKPVYELLGGKKREAVATKWSVSGQLPEVARNIARWALAQGFTKMKVKVGIEPVQDVERVKAVREVVGPDMKLGVDANGGWPDPDVAISTIQKLRDLDICFVEQPVPAGDVEQMATVRRAVDVPIIADESLYTLGDAKMLARDGACDVFSIYIGKSGGIGPAREIARFAGQRNIACTIGSNLELAVGSAAMAHLAVACEAIAPEQYPCDIIGPFYYQDRIDSIGINLTPGHAIPTDRPGLGVELDEAKVAKYRVG